MEINLPTDYSKVLWLVVCIASFVAALIANAGLQKQVVEPSRWENAVWLLKFGVVWLLPILTVMAFLTSHQAMQSYEQELGDAKKKIVRSRQLTNGPMPYQELCMA